MDEKKKSGIKAVLAKLEQATDEGNEKVVTDCAFQLLEMVSDEAMTNKACEVLGSIMGKV